MRFQILLWEKEETVKVKIVTSLEDDLDNPIYLHREETIRWQTTNIHTALLFIYHWVKLYKKCLS
jgi:hypothetical protein